MSVFEWLVGSASFIPHGVCLAWRPDLVALHAVSDLLIAASYFAIPIAIWIFVRKRLDLSPAHRRVAVLFSAFILACGLSHVTGLVTLWVPLYGTQGLVKAGTAAVSVVTAFLVFPLLPQLLKLPSPSALAESNAELSTALAELQAVRADLEAQVESRTEQLRRLNERFERALADSPIAVFEQDEDLRYTWIHNPQLGMQAAEVVGKTDADIMVDPGAVVHVKREALALGETRRGDVEVEGPDGASGHYLLTSTPTVLDDGRRGLISVAVDVTDKVRHQRHLQLVTRELSHRTKNLLSMIQAIARQSSMAAKDVKDFNALFGSRLRSLAQVHDVLVRADWTGAPLGELIRRQTEVFPGASERIRAEGPAYDLAPEGAHYLGLALHELCTNAVKHGALARKSGKVKVRWTVAEDGTLTLIWRESGATVPAEPSRKGFGRMLLEDLVPGALAGSAVLAFEEKGVVWTLTAPPRGAEAAEAVSGRSEPEPA